MMIMVMSDDIYAIKNNNSHATSHHDFNFEFEYANLVSQDS